MKYYFNIINELGSPIFSNNLGCSFDYRICLDTGCGVTIFYFGIEVLTILYPDIRKTNISITLRNADGSKSNEFIYIIPTFKLIDNNKNIIFIKNLYCVVLEKAEMENIDVLLSGDLFHSCSLTIRPNRKNNKVIGRLIRINTLRKDKIFLIVKPSRDSKNDIFYPAYLCSQT